MKHLKPQFLIAVLTIAFLTSCLEDDFGNGNNNRFVGSEVIITEARTIDDFNAIVSSPAIELNITQGANQSVEVTSNNNLIDRVITRVSAEGVLTIEMREGSYENLRLRVNIAIPELISVENLGAGTIFIHEFTDQESLTLRNIGAASFTVAGSSDQLTIDLLGAGNMSAFEFATRQVSINLAGSGNIEVSASQRISGSIAGAGNILYRGEPEIDVNITGAGSVIDAN